MKKIFLSNYHNDMGKLIDVRKPSDYMKSPIPYSINIYLDNLLLNHKTLLNKEEKYYIICNKGFLSKKAVSILEYYGYDVTHVINKQ